MAMTSLDSPQVIKSVFDDANQALKVVQVGTEVQVSIRSEDGDSVNIKSDNAYKNISSNTTTLVKTGPGQLRSITINTSGASSNTATVYDGVDSSGTKIATIDTTSKGTLSYDVAFSVGLAIVTATGTSADITVSYS